MNQRQKKIVRDLIVVLLITAAAVVGMINFKDYVNRSESMLAMNNLAEIIKKYKQQNGVIPPEYYIQDIKQQLQGQARLGKLHYRARWIDFDSEPNEILAYAIKDYTSPLIKNDAIVLRLDGTVKRMPLGKFREQLKSQQTKLEVEILQQDHPDLLVTK